MITIHDINKLRPGLKIIQGSEPCIIIHSELVKPGKGQAFNRVRFRKLISGKILEKTFKSGDSVKLADVEELNLMYLYSDGIHCCFMHLKTFDQIYVCYKVLKGNIKWLVERLCYTIIFWNSDPIFLVPPHFIELEVIDIQPAIKGDTVSPSTKLAVLSTGVLVKVPLFIQKGEFIKVNTRSSEYVSRIK